MRIALLPSLLANQIAAGEVIERPASVVKELLENSLDAGAHKIEITLHDGGSRLIKISDDGCGIEPDDLLLAVTSHATSKIAQLEDLFAITSLGFRGEALASIAAVARCQLISKVANQATAYQLSVAAREQSPQIVPAAHPQGTTVVVQDLFFNTPVRRKFLYSEKTEFQHIEQVVKRILLSRYDVAFKLTHNDKMLWQLPAIVSEAAQQTRVRKIFGAAFLTQAVFIDVTYHGMRMWGWLGLPEFMRSQNDLQYCFLNGRMLRDKLINHAIKQAYEAKLYPGRQPAYLLYLTLDPSQVDVNVHPTKHEVRFCEARLVHDFLVSQITKALGATTMNVSHYIAEAKPDYHVTENQIADNQIAARPQWVSSASQYSVAPITPRTTLAPQQPVSEFQVLAWLPPHYWLVANQQQHILCDYQYGYQQLITDSLQQPPIKTRPLLVPLKFTLQPNEIIHLMQYFEPLEILGVQLAQLDQATVVFRQLPVISPYLNLSYLLQLLLEKPPVSTHNTALIALIAKASPAGKHLTAAEVAAILALLQQQVSTTAPHAGFKIMNEVLWREVMQQ